MENARIPLDSLVLLGGTFAAGIARRLSSLPALRVIPPERLDALEMPDASPEEIARALCVTCAVVCTVEELSCGVDLRVEVIDALAERVVAEERFLAGAGELASLETHAFRWVAQQLLGHFTPKLHR